MAKILLDYVFPIEVIESIAAASTSWLKQVCLVVSPKSGQEGNVGTVYECTTMAQVLARTDNEEAEQLFNAGMSKVFILLADDLDLAAALAAEPGEFFTLLISSDFDDDAISSQDSGTVTITSYANLVSGGDDVVTVGGVAFTAQAGAASEGDATFQAATSNDATAASLAAQINAHPTASELVEASVDGAVVTIKDLIPGPNNTVPLTYTDNDTNVGATLGGLSGGKLDGGAILDVGTFDGVVGISSDDEDFLAEQAVIANRSAFFTSASNGAKNLCYAFGSLLSNSVNWLNQQYITMPVSDGIEELGDALSLFDDKISFVLEDDEFGIRLGLFAVGGKAIVAPYILKNLRIDMQSRALSWIAANQPDYTKTEATLLETRLQEDVINDYIQNKKWIEAGTVLVSIDEDSNFVATGEINVSEPKALWRVVSEMSQTL